ncbi:MAG: efflux RND transporter permease subunit [Methylococcales bacterium]
MTSASALQLKDFNNIPTKREGNAYIYLHDVADARLAGRVQTNSVLVDGKQSVMIVVMKSSEASTLEVVDGIKEMIPRIEKVMPEGVKVKLINDASTFVKDSISDVVHEMLTAAALVGLIVLLLGSWRPTLVIATTIPLSILISLIVLHETGQSINVMTLGGLALAVGVLVDNATVMIENIDTHIEMGKPLETAIIDAANQIVLPTFVATLAIAIVWFPFFDLSGVSGWLFMPMAEAIIFAMLASFALSFTLLPTMAKYILVDHNAPKAHPHPGHPEDDQAAEAVYDLTNQEAEEEALANTGGTHFAVAVPDPDYEAESARGFFGRKLAGKLRHIPGARDVVIQQTMRTPTLLVEANRSFGLGVNLSQQDFGDNLLMTTAGSQQVDQQYWLDRKTGVSYRINVYTPQSQLTSLNDLLTVPVDRDDGDSSQTNPELLGNVATLSAGGTPGAVTHGNIMPLFDIYVSPEGRELGAVLEDVEKAAHQLETEMPRSAELAIRGQAETMRQTYIEMIGGLLAAIVLVYLLIVINFHSWLDPFIIISALPGALAGIAWFLFLTHTNLSTPALTGAIMTMGTATSNSILVVAYARERLELHGDALGNIQAWFEAPIYAQVSGYVQMWDKDYGAQVKKGDVLAEINAPALDAQYEQAKADLESVRAEYALAELTAKRYLALRTNHAVSEQSISVKVAEAKAQAATVKAAEQSVKNFEALIRFKTIVAPYDGVVTVRNINVGDYVNKEGTMSAPGAISNLFTVADIHRMRLFVNVPESLGAFLKPGLTADVTVARLPNRHFTAKFLTVARGFDVNTRTAVTEFTIDNEASGKWREMRPPSS